MRPRRPPARVAGVLEDLGAAGAAAGQGIAQGAQAAGQGAGQGAQQFGQAAGQGAQQAGQGVQQVGQGLGQGAQQAGAGIGEGGRAVGKAAGSVADTADTAAQWAIGLAIGVPVVAALVGGVIYVVTRKREPVQVLLPAPMQNASPAMAAPAGPPATSPRTLAAAPAGLLGAASPLAALLGPGTLGAASPLAGALGGAGAATPAAELLEYLTPLLGLQGAVRVVNASKPSASARPVARPATSIGGDLKPGLQGIWNRESGPPVVVRDPVSGQWRPPAPDDFVTGGRS